MTTRATERAHIRIVPHFSRLHEWVALEEGYFEEEGLEPELSAEVMHGVSTHHGDPYGRRPQDLPFVDPSFGTAANSACQWGSACNAGAGMGKFVKDLYSVGRYAIFVRPGSRVERLHELADIPVGIGEMAGSHFTSLAALSQVLPAERISLDYVGGPGQRLLALLGGTVEAATLLDPEIPMAEAKGLRKLAHGEFIVTFWVSPDSRPQVLGAYFRALLRAEDALQRDLATYLPLWARNVPPGLEGDHDYATFGRGEALTRQPYTREMFEDAVSFAERWDLVTHMRDRDYDNLAARVAL